MVHHETASGFMTEERKFSEALEYHSSGRPGKIQIQPTKPTATANDLGLAYSPGVAEPCLEIHRRADDAFLYTNRGNLVAVVSNGSAVLGLGNIGALAGKPVMEGKAVLFKRFADIDVFDIELDTADPDEIIRTCQLLEPTFGGINLEDIKAPECFVIEEKLKATMDIPVFHDDQHGTAIIAAAALTNACEITGRDIGEIRVVINGAGAAGVACARLLILMGIDAAKLLMCDSKGVIHDGRSDLNVYKQAFAVSTERRSLSDAMKGADCFVGVSVKDVVSAEMVQSMAPRPIVFALANPDPEIRYELAKNAVPDAIVATGRTDFPNQVNNVLGFPFLFRGALDVRATGISDRMKVAAARAISSLAKEPVPASVLKAYEVDSLEFGSDYIIPKPFDPRVLWHVAPAVAQAATDEGIARNPLADVEGYRDRLRRKFQASYSLMHSVTVRAQQQPKQLVLPQGPDPRVLRAARRMVDENIACPVILGDVSLAEDRAREIGVDLTGITVLDPLQGDRRREQFAQRLFERRQRRGMTLPDAEQALRNPYMYAAMMVREGAADALLGGLSGYFPETLRPALQVIDLQPGRSVVSAVYVLLMKGRPYFFGDCAVNLEPTAEQLAEIALATAAVAREMETEPRVALLSHSNFGSVKSAESQRVRRAVQLCRELDPELSVDGEMHADTAVDKSILDARHPFHQLHGSANVLIFPNLAAANSAYKLLHLLGSGELIGPILTGFSKPVHVLQRDAEVGEIMNLAAIAVLDAQRP
jgi:malate dehydrogenase (oxaloacetate-decarboxylating)(NADP+)